MKSFLDSMFCKSISYLLCFLTAIQGIPLWELSQKYELKYNHERAEAVLEFMAEVIAPASAEAGSDIRGDIDGDCNVDQIDANILLLDRNKTVGASSCGTKCDLDGDGVITVLDARKLTVLCTKPKCAVCLHPAEGGRLTV